MTAYEKHNICYFRYNLAPAAYAIIFRTVTPHISSTILACLYRNNFYHDGFHNALVFFNTSTNSDLWRLFKELKYELVFSALKNTQLFRGDIPNKKTFYQIADSKIKRKLKIFDDNVDAEKFTTNLVNVIKFWAQLPCDHNIIDSNNDLYCIMVIYYNSSAQDRTVQLT